MYPFHLTRGFLAAQLLWTLPWVLSASGEEDGTLREVVEHGLLQAQPAALPRTGLCVKDTARSCRAWHKDSSNYIDHVTQCLAGTGSPHFLDASAAADPNQPQASADQASCSADLPPQTAVAGTCICGPGHCADTDRLCHRGTYQMVNEIFTITTKAYPNEKLYMTPDGKIKLGYPPDPRAAQWRVSMTGQGVKILWTELYMNTIMQEYESCATVTDSFGLSSTQCSRIVGNVPNPRADEMGWFIELFGDVGHQRLGLQPESHVQIRSASTWDMFYIDPLTKEGMACETRARNCPPESGAFKFDPPLVGRMDFVLDYAPGTLPPGLAAYTTTVMAAGILVFCVSCVFASDRKSKGCCTDCLLIPFREIASHFSFGQGAKI